MARDERTTSKGEGWSIAQGSRDGRFVTRKGSDPFPPKGDVRKSKGASKLARSSKTGRVERAFSSASKRTGAFEKKY